MKFAFLLSNENIEVSKAEVLALSKKENYELLDSFLILDFHAKTKILSFLAKRLAFTKSIHKILFICKKNNLVKRLKTFPWKTIYEKNFKLSIHGTKEFKESDFANYIYDNIKNPKVDLKNPNTQIEIHFVDNQVIATLKLYELKDDYESRKSHKRPKHHPTAMHPRWAKALINLTGIREGKLLDPMCGAGGFLIEAGLMGLFPVGYDIDKDMLERARINLKHFNIEDYKLQRIDATIANQKFRYVLTDLPYGKNTKSQDMEKLYSKFFRQLKKIIKVRGVIVTPSHINCKSLLKNAKLKIHNEFSQYVHHTMTRKIFVVSPWF